jgi:hypothetical protein
MGWGMEIRTLNYPEGDNDVLKPGIHDGGHDDDAPHSCPFYTSNLH